ncbi:hypothetical protein N7509_005258 [Penicillium cosmopolitanum]|uniref:NADH:ubiquinone oxidoreductase intermediate-associated protein 30 domain-containing protein n=1 Tax=Penicillium cosmopolitanum TaxID=1131564 RepID=A0A9W9W1W8_9EURO|nr:uncharacterized protein N7509_005258 [Penicillium cosmopolitanum]KAJ5397145.1 hypothetical protein N7509_005258 [Penicillium cosmopolitanum]
MIPTRRLASQAGFFRRSAEELGRLSKIALNAEGLHTPTKAYTLLDFEDSSSVEGCKTMADRVVGGFSTASLDYDPGLPSANIPPHARFHGKISTKLPSNFRVDRTGYAAFRNQDRGVWLFGRLYWDLDPYSYLALRIKSDGRRYTVNIQTDSIVDTDIHQHRLYTRHHRVRGTPTAPLRNPSESREHINEMYPHGRPDALSDTPPESTIISSSSSATTSGSTGWETVLLPLTSFVRTNFGYVVEPQTSIMRNRVKSIGIGLTDRIDGPFDLRIHKIWATNGMDEHDAAEDKLICGAHALPVDEGVRTGWAASKLLEKEAEKETGEQQTSQTKKKGLQGLRSEWDE